MSRKDVELVIRAKDEAEKVISAVTKALKGFVDAQDGVQKSGDGTGATLAALSTAMANLERQVKGIDLGSTLTKDMDRAAESVTRLEAATRKAATEIVDLERKVDQTGAGAARYTQKLQGATAAQERQTQVVAKAKAESKALEAAHGTAAAAVERLTTKQASLPDAIAKQSEAVSKAATRYSELSSQMSGTTEPSATLARNFESSSRSLATQQEKLTRLRTELATVESELRAAGSAATIFGAQSAQATEVLNRENAVLGKIGANFTDLKAKTSSATGEFDRNTASLNRSRDAAVRQTEQLARAEDQYVELAQAAGKFDKALSSAGTAGKGGLEKQLVDQGIAITKAQKELGVLSNATRRYSEVMLLAGPPTREMSQRLAFMAQRVDESQMKLELNREAMQNMGAAYRNVTADINSVTDGQARFLAEQNKLSASMKTVAADGFRERQAIREVHTEAEKAANSTGRMAVETGKQGNNARKAAGDNSALAEAYRKVYGDSRKALSITQRLRGQVLSLVAAYGGFYGVVNILGKVIDAYRVLEGIQNRLNAAFQGDTAQAAADYDWLRRNADRLGISLAVLGDEYSKFAVAAKAANFENKNIRKTFLAVAEAGRVNKLSMEQMSGIFLALQQMISKGKVTSEELRRQLGDRLPGAFNIMADALDMTTAQLDKAMQSGEVLANESTLLAFAQELDLRFGGSLPAALETMTTALGQLGNAAFMALVKFGQGGFIDAITRIARDLSTTLKDAGFESFMERASAAAGVLVDTLGVLVRNFKLVFAAITGFIGLKLAPIIIAITAKMWAFVASAAGAAESMVVFAATARGTAGATAAATAGVARLTGALRILMSSTAIGLFITAVAAGIGLWLASANEATEALNLHLKMLDKVKNAYDEMEGNVGTYQVSGEAPTVSEAEANLLRLSDAVAATREKIAAQATGMDSIWSNFFGYDLLNNQKIYQVSSSYTAALNDVFRKFETGQIKARELTGALDEVIKQFGDGSRGSVRFGESVIKLARELTEQTGATKQASEILVTLTGTADEAQEAFDSLAGSTDDLGKSLEEVAADKAALFKSAMDELGKSVASVKRELDYIEASKAIEELGRKAIENAANVDELAAAIKRAADAQSELSSDYVDGQIGGSLVDRIIGVESAGDPNAKNPNSSATGLGQFISSTWLRMFKEYFPDRAAGMSDAMIVALRTDAKMSRSMVELYIKENAQYLHKMGVAITDANLYLAHFLGPGGAAKLLKSAPGSQASDSLGAAAVNANSGILSGKTREQVIAWAEKKVGISKQELSVIESMQTAEQKRDEDARKASEKAAADLQKKRDGTSKTIADNDFEIEQQRLKNAELKKEAAIQAAIREAKLANPEITDAELEKIKAQTAAIYDLQNAKEAELATKKRATEAEAAMNLLLQQRNALQEQFDIAKKQGDVSLQAELKTKMAEVNVELLAAIENAKAMWAAVGGPEADTAIEKLNAASASAHQFGAAAGNARIEWEKVGDMIVTGLVGAFDMFAQAVANGESAGEAARKAFLKFASDFLIEIGRMIIKQAILNMLKAAFGGSSFGGMIGLGHTGGMVGSKRVGSGNSSRKVDPSIFSGAMRYHTGGIVGLMPGEIPIIAKQGEEMLTRDDPRHALNIAGAGGNNAGGGGNGGGATIVNTFDADSFLQAGLASPAGRKLMMNFVSANKSVIKGVLS